MSLIATAEAARQLGVSRQRIGQLVQLGKLTAERDHGRVMIRQEDVTARLAGAEVRPDEVTVAGAASRRGVHRDTIRRWISLGLPVTKRLGLNYIKVSDLDAYAPNSVGRPRGSAK